MEVHSSRLPIHLYKTSGICPITGIFLFINKGFWIYPFHHSPGKYLPIRKKPAASGTGAGAVAWNVF